MRVRSLHGEDPLEKEMATHSSILAWEIPWTEEPGGLQSMGWHRVEMTEVTEQQHDKGQSRKQAANLSSPISGSLLTHLS